ncbi:hypothetical protein CGMCC3_g1252 [Colletotrichum fructicola]|nr:uncharacterized protein CGMCC3_g1252 [Colletotrichum fructicola]KAE9583305.1 hypothetical protein CGMCC3_g1252 [Colletotrichum fructicola]
MSSSGLIQSFLLPEASTLRHLKEEAAVPVPPAAAWNWLLPVQSVVSVRSCDGWKVRKVDRLLPPVSSEHSRQESEEAGAPEACAGRLLPMDAGRP